MRRRPAGRNRPGPLPLNSLQLSSQGNRKISPGFPGFCSLPYSAPLSISRTPSVDKGSSAETCYLRIAGMEPRDKSPLNYAFVDGQTPTAENVEHARFEPRDAEARDIED